MKVLLFAGLFGTTLSGALLWFSGLGTFIWFAGTSVLPDDLGFGYYEDFNTARKAIAKSTCAESIQYSRHEDSRLESFHFKIQTESGWLVRLWFVEEMEVKELCASAQGLVVLSPTNWEFGSQVYSVDDLSKRFPDKGIRAINVNDLLCNMGEFAPMFKANYNNPDIRQITYEEEDFNRYLRIEIVEEGRGDYFIYRRIR